MYEELIKQLLWMEDVCKKDISCPVPCINECLFKEAADAIEKLSMRIHGDEAAIAGMKREIERMVVADKPRWIPVTERLPEDGQWVLVWGHGQKIPIMMFRESGAWIDDQFEFHTTITFWTPLPEPPKDGET